MKRYNIPSLVIITTLFFSGAVFASNPPVISSFWAPITMSQKVCVQKASGAIKTTGFTQRFAVQQDNIFGVSNDLTNTGKITCIAKKGIAFFTVAGISDKKTYSLSQELYKQFKN